MSDNLKILKRSNYIRMLSAAKGINGEVAQLVRAHDS